MRISCKKDEGKGDVLSLVPETSRVAGLHIFQVAAVRRERKQKQRADGGGRRSTRVRQSQRQTSGNSWATVSNSARPDKPPGRCRGVRTQPCSRPPPAACIIPLLRSFTTTLWRWRASCSADLVLSSLQYWFEWPRSAQMKVCKLTFRHSHVLSLHLARWRLCIPFQEDTQSFGQ